MSDSNFEACSKLWFINQFKGVIRKAQVRCRGIGGGYYEDDTQLLALLTQTAWDWVEPSTLEQASQGNKEAVKKVNQLVYGTYAEFLCCKVFADYREAIEELRLQSLNYVLAKGYSLEDAEDIAQQVAAIICVRYIKAGKLDRPRALLALLYRVTQTRLIDLWRMVGQERTEAANCESFSSALRLKPFSLNAIRSLDNGGERSNFLERVSDKKSELAYEQVEFNWEVQLLIEKMLVMIASNRLRAVEFITVWLWAASFKYKEIIRVFETFYNRQTPVLLATQLGCEAATIEKICAKLVAELESAHKPLIAGTVRSWCSIGLAKIRQELELVNFSALVE